MPNPGGRPRPGRRGLSASRIAPAGPSFTSSASRTCSPRTRRETFARSSPTTAPTPSSSSSAPNAREPRSPRRSPAAGGRAPDLAGKTTRSTTPVPPDPARRASCPARCPSGAFPPIARSPARPPATSSRSCDADRAASPPQRTSTRTSGPSWSPDSSRRCSCTSPREEKVKAPMTYIPMTSPGMTRGTGTGTSRVQTPTGTNPEGGCCTARVGRAATASPRSSSARASSSDARWTRPSPSPPTCGSRGAKRPKRSWGAIPRISRRTSCAEPRCCCWSTTRAGREVATTKTGTKSRHPGTGTGTGMGMGTRTRRRERAPR